MGDNSNAVNLPPGFQFYPNDEELVVHFLHRKAACLPIRHPNNIPDLDISPYDPWDLEDKALAGGNGWYFFSRRVKDRVTANGYWIPLGEESVAASGTSKKVGMKKYLAFYTGDGVETNWIMHEFRLLNFSSSSSTRPSKSRGTPKIDPRRLVLCRIFEKYGGSKGSGACNDDEDGTELSCLDEVFLSLDDLDEISLPSR
ncbi:hypothetical protein GIB67_029816 [Kingdonia uniflora]|uniref:NAC domain-containing protein n=1 Tax=Kingdonia uniflora TaxID=39325 RepID=A0A7J7NJV6_9MAGN|nr:hypothetical protein GIB67_029816 [Kingdonia uniflora]